MDGKKKYRVLNPRGIREGVPLISYRKGDVSLVLYDGDIFTPPPGFDSDGDLLRQGCYEEVTDG